MKRLLFVGDGPDCPSGFGRATREILEVVRWQYDVTVLGINHRGDPGTVAYPVYTAAVGGDSMGIGRLIWMCDLLKPDIIILQNDGWNIPGYIRQLQQFEQYKRIPVITIVPVDGQNFQSKWLYGVDHAIFWTQFALNEVRASGWQGPATVIPLGIDITNYTPMDRADARCARKLDSLQDAFIVGNVNRNQPRKRWDLTVRYFADWVQTKGILDAWLYLHTAPTGDMGTDVKQLSTYYGINLALNEPPVWYGESEETMRETYNCFDVQISTTQGEGFGFTAMEGMACGVPQIVPDWSALGELAAGAAMLVPCTSTAIGPPYVNVIGGIADEWQFVDALDRIYREPELRAQLRADGLARVREERFRWQHIGEQVLSVLDGVLAPTPTEVPV